MTKKSIENEFSDQKLKYLKNLNDIEEKVLNFQQLYLQSFDTKQNPLVPINLEIETIKELISDEENRIKNLNSPLAQQPPIILNLKSSSNNILNSSTNNNYNENVSSYYTSKR